MSNRTLALTETVYQYLLNESVREPQVLADLRAETLLHPSAGMQISPEQGQFLRFLVQTLGVRRALELGVFTGYSSTAIALALPTDGKLVACDVSAEYTDVARKYWERAGVEDKVELRLGTAVASLGALLLAGGLGSFDFAFVDADKENYVSYYKLCLKLVRPGGVIAFDNALWDGRVADENDRSASTMAIREVTRLAFSDSNVNATLLPIGDGLLLVRRRT